ncbi:MAG: TolC family protein, partial [Woeseiaceae bacterium]|nr:TolC family protein [Woeseiaceae bacterium]
MKLRLTRKNVVCLFLVVGGCSSNVVDNTPLPGPTVTGLTLAALAETQPIDLSLALNSDDIATIAVFTNPELRAIRAREGVSQAQVFAAGLIPDPSFSLGAD